MLKSDNKVNTLDSNQSKWTIYIVRCADESLYTGITNDLERRLREHNDSSTNSKGAKYTRARQPVKLAYQEKAPDRASASRREYQIKQLSRTEKLKLCSN